MRTFLLSILFSVFSFSLYAQSDYASPVNIPVTLAGNVGEIRSGHFHSGVDFKTDGVTGKAILSIADGYVSRISIGEGGYGKALYIMHPDGRTSVYAHLESFNTAIGNYVRDEQYKRKMYAVELYPGAGTLPVKRGETVALSGNSGSSGGPHLHFEIRNGAQRPLNVMTLGYVKAEDTQAPRLMTLWVVGIDTLGGIPVHRVLQKYPLQKTGEQYTVAAGSAPVKIPATAYFAIELTDTKNGSPSNTFGIRTLEQSVDGRVNFSLLVDNFTFDNTRYVHSILYYPLYRSSRYDVLRCYAPPNRLSALYPKLERQGVVALADTVPHQIRITVGDDVENRSVLAFDVVRSNAFPAAVKPAGIPVLWNKPASYDDGQMTIILPAKVLYESTYLSVLERPRPKGALSPAYTLANDQAPLQTAMTLNLKIDAVPAALYGKLCFVSYDRDSTSRTYEGGSLQAGRMTLTTRTYGTYYVVADTLAPRITPNFQQGANLAGAKSLSFNVRDELSGIKRWAVYVDDAWALCEHDPKSHTITHFFADARYATGKTHTIRIEAEDDRGNRTVVSSTFVR